MRPFPILPDPEVLFWSPGHRRAFTILEYGVLTGAPLMLLTGGAGTGKTTLLQALLCGLDDRVTAGLVTGAGGGGALLGWVLNAFGCDASGDPVALHQRWQDFLIAEYAAGRRTLLILDEAQSFSDADLDTLRRLSNINSGTDMLLQIVLCGQPELRARIRNPALRPLAQRIASAAHLEPLDAAGVAAYLAFRLRTAGGTGAEIEADAATRLGEVAGGVPRVLNAISTLALVHAAAEGGRAVAAADIDAVLAAGLVLTTVDPAREAAE